VAAVVVDMAAAISRLTCRQRAASKSRDLYFVNLTRRRPDVGQTCVNYRSIHGTVSVRLSVTSL